MQSGSLFRLLMIGCVGEVARGTAGPPASTPVGGNPQPDHLGAFVEMAQTWEQLADLHELTQRLRSSGVLLEPRAI
jgi:hypothetical protein